MLDFEAIYESDIFCKKYKFSTLITADGKFISSTYNRLRRQGNLSCKI